MHPLNGSVLEEWRALTDGQVAAQVLIGRTTLFEVLTRQPRRMKMESRAKLLRHPIHQMLIVFSLGLLAMAVVFDLFTIALSFGAGGLALFTGWLGGELVDRLGVGVDGVALIDAPSSLARRRVGG